MTLTARNSAVYEIIATYLSVCFRQWLDSKEAIEMTALDERETKAIKHEPDIAAGFRAIALT